MSTIKINNYEQVVNVFEADENVVNRRDKFEKWIRSTSINLISCGVIHKNAVEEKNIKEKLAKEFPQKNYVIGFSSFQDGRLIMQVRNLHNNEFLGNYAR